ncbi:MAG: LacI family transcriptional regulator [Chloroflexi bacterium]|nr:LacI family transcriptional regulator [Chloroflexota bacterium]MYE79244.1 LacI family transcriptional regulator [Chloroflexota bacterium]
MPITIEDLASKLGVSPSTVSKALNDRADVSLRTKERVRKTVRELGYQPSAAARNLRRQRTDKIGLVVNYPIHMVRDFLTELIPGIAARAEQSEYHLILYTAMAGNAERVKSLCRSREVDGIIIAWPPRASETVALSQLMTQEDMPHVFLPRRVPHEGISFVAADHIGGAKALTWHLICLGHRRIGFERLPEVYETDFDRHAGYCQALAEAGIAYQPDLVVAADSSAVDYATRSFRLFSALPEPPTAVLFFTDPVAIRALSLARQAGLRVPQDLSIAGYDGILSSAVTEPALTTVWQSAAEMGRLAVESLLQLISGEGNGPIQHTLPVKLFARGSTGAKQGG